jgi:hypothetical protein
VSPWQWRCQYQNIITCHSYEVYTIIDIYLFCTILQIFIIRKPIGTNHVIQGYCLLGCGTTYSGRNSPFWRNLLPPFSGSKSKPSKQQEATSKHSTPHQACTIWKNSYYNSITEAPTLGQTPTYPQPQSSTHLLSKMYPYSCMLLSFHPWKQAVDPQQPPHHAPHCLTHSSKLSNFCLVSTWLGAHSRTSVARVIFMLFLALKRAV